LEAARVLVDAFESVIAEFLNDALGEGRPDAVDQAGAEIGEHGFAPFGSLDLDGLHGELLAKAWMHLEVPDQCDRLPLLELADRPAHGDLAAAFVQRELPGQEARLRIAEPDLAQVAAQGLGPPAARVVEALLHRRPDLPFRCIQASCVLDDRG
jgi:hypothetical protein